MPNINKNIIMQAGAAVANATNKAAGLAAATPEPGAIISAIQLVNGGRTIGPAALAHFTESVRNKLLSLRVSMEPIQDFNGYGHPWPGGGGINKFDGLWNGATSSFNYATNYIPVTAGEQYFVATPNMTSDNVYVDWCDSEKVVLSQNYARNSTVTAPTGAVFARLKLWFTLDNTDIAFNYPATIRTYSPYSNICPISGRTGLDVYVSPTTAQADATTYSVDWTTQAGTVYGGTLDVVTGLLTVNLAMVDFGTLTWSKSSATPSHFYASSTQSAIPYKYSDSCYMICSDYKYDGPGNTTVGGYYGQNGTFRYYYASSSPSSPTREFYITDEAKAALTAAEFKAAMNGVQLVYELATPLAYQLSAQDVVTLVGFNYIWSDDGNVTITE